MLQALVYAVLFVYAITMIRATPAQRTASVVAVVGGDADVIAEWEALGSRYVELRDTFARVARETGVSASLLAGIAWVESKFDADAINPKSGAAGLMQVMPMHFNAYGLSGGEWKVPYKNIKAGARILIASGYGKRGMRRTLANYGGFVKNDPSPYIRKVLARASFIGLHGNRA
jgi:soluble lytic murein transglycosylase-like protein